MTTYELCQSIRSSIVNRAAEVMNYHSWSPDFCAGQIRELVETIQSSKSFTPIQPADLTSSEMDDLDFGRWNEHSTDRLIPLWLYPFLAEEIKCCCIDGSAGTMKKSEMDNDHRFGCLAYSVQPKDMFVKAVEDGMTVKAG